MSTIEKIHSRLVSCSLVDGISHALVILSLSDRTVHGGLIGLDHSCLTDHCILFEGVLYTGPSAFSTLDP